MSQVTPAAHLDDMTAPNLHLFPLILIEIGHPGQSAVDFKPAQTQRIETGPEHKATIRFERGRLNVWLRFADDRDISRGHQGEAHLAYAHLTEFDENNVAFEGMWVEDSLVTNRPARVRFTNHHQGWE